MLVRGVAAAWPQQQGSHTVGKSTRREKGGRGDNVSVGVIKYGY